MDKGLEALNEIKSTWNCMNPNSSLAKYSHFDIIEKELKALEIIKVVCPNVFWVMRTYTYEEYKKKCSDDTLLQEEYDLLKEVLL